MEIFICENTECSINTTKESLHYIWDNFLNTFLCEKYSFMHATMIDYTSI